LNGRNLLLVANGIGGRRAVQAVEAALSAASVDAVVSLGFCGALDPDLAIGNIFVASRIQGDEGSFATQLPEAPHRFASGLLVSIDHVAQTAEEKARLWSTGAAAVEMEAAGVAAVAARHGLPLYCIRSVTDLAGEAFANDLNAALRPDGQFDVMHLLRNAVRKPTVRFPELLRLYKRSTLAARTLGEFIAGCRF
jgi:adenosylhomocysteine nucleosidase